MTGIPATLESLWRDFYGSVVTGGFGQLVALTAPLTFSVGVVSWGWRRGWWEQTGPIPMGAVIVAGAWLGQLLGHPGSVTAADVLPTGRYGLLGDTVLPAGNLLIAYYREYGHVSFLASVIVGIWLGQCWDRWVGKVSARLGLVAAPTDASVAEGPPATASRAA
jgi:hypothetical protein